MKQAFFPPHHTSHTLTCTQGTSITEQLSRKCWLDLNPPRHAWSDALIPLVVASWIFSIRSPSHNTWVNPMEHIFLALRQFMTRSCSLTQGRLHHRHMKSCSRKYTATYHSFLYLEIFSETLCSYLHTSQHSRDCAVRKTCPKFENLPFHHSHGLNTPS